MIVCEICGVVVGEREKPEALSVLNFNFINRILLIVCVRVCVVDMKCAFVYRCGVVSHIETLAAVQMEL